MTCTTPMPAGRVPTCGFVGFVGFGRIAVVTARMMEIGTQERWCDAIPSTAHEEVGNASCGDTYAAHPPAQGGVRAVLRADSGPGGDSVSA